MKALLLAALVCCLPLGASSGQYGADESAARAVVAAPSPAAARGPDSRPPRQPADGSPSYGPALPYTDDPCCVCPVGPLLTWPCQLYLPPPGGRRMPAPGGLDPSDTSCRCLKSGRGRDPMIPTQTVWCRAR